VVALTCAVVSPVQAPTQPVFLKSAIAPVEQLVDVSSAGRARLAGDGIVQVEKVPRGERYRLVAGRHGGDPAGDVLMQVKEGGDCRHGGDPDKVISPENRSSAKTGQKRPGCQKWFDGYLEDLRAQGHKAVDGFAVREAGVAAGYSMNSLYVAAHKRGLKGDIWSLPGSRVLPSQ
jgi:hypothetical protein